MITEVPKLLFVSCSYKFFDDGFAQDMVVEEAIRIHMGRDHIKKTNPWCVNYEPALGAKIYWIWDDNTMSLAADEIQHDYEKYLATLIVGTDEAPLDI